jgi:hypothetical protein
MKARWFLCLVVLGMVGTSAWATPTNYFFPSSFAANPQGEWSLAYGTSPTSMTSMVSGGSGNWYSTDPFRPSYGEYGQEFRFWDTTANSAYLVFTCPQTGTYSMDYSVYSEMQGNNHWGIYSFVDVGTLTGAGYSSLYSNNHPWGSGPYRDDFAAASVLQNMSLSAGDQILVGMRMQQFGSYSEMVTRIQASPTTPEVGANITFVPEPATLGLLTMGGLLLRRRK